MNYKMPFQIPDDQIDAIVIREAKKQKLKFKSLSLQHLKALADVGGDIQKWGLPKHLLRKKLPYNLGDGIFLHPDAKPLLKGSLVAVYTGKRCIVPQNLLEDALYAFEPLSDMHLTKQEQHFFDPRARFHPRRLYCIHVDAQKQIENKLISELN